MALAASLLLLVGLTRAFKLIGDRITSSQSELEMAGSLRESTYRLRDELRRMTAPMKSPLAANSNQGYFTYYEGPWTDATTSIVHGFSPPPTSGMLEYIPTSRIGDLDDYVAFTHSQRAWKAIFRCGAKWRDRSCTTAKVACRWQFRRQLQDIAADTFIRIYQC